MTMEDHDLQDILGGLHSLLVRGLSILSLSKMRIFNQIIRNLAGVL